MPKTDNAMLGLTVVGTIAAVIAAIPLLIGWWSDRPELKLDDSLTGRTYIAADFYDPSEAPTILVTNRGEKPAIVNSVTLASHDKTIDFYDDRSRRAFFQSNAFDSHALRWDQPDVDEAFDKNKSFRLFFIKLGTFKPELAKMEARADSLNQLTENLREIVADIKYNGRYHAYWPATVKAATDDKGDIKWAWAMIIFVSIFGSYSAYRSWQNVPK